MLLESYITMSSRILSQHCGNLLKLYVFPCCYNIVTVLIECCLNMVCRPKYNVATILVCRLKHVSSECHILSTADILHHSCNIHSTIACMAASQSRTSWLSAPCTGICTFGFSLLQCHLQTG